MTATIAYTRVRGRCPACGHHTLELGRDAHLQCTHPDCPNPDAADQVLADATPDHVVHVGAGDFSIRHPLVEHTSDRDLLDCPLHLYLALHHEAPVPPGIYRVHRSDTIPPTWRWDEVPA